jgi:CTP:molybdopterin cytidylyltransferase MocA
MGAELRLHVRLLLIDFLGQVANPDDFEVILLVERLAIPDERRRVLLAIRGSEQWFQALCSTHFPTVMRWEVSDAWPMIGVIEEAWRFAHDDCFRLVEEYWLIDPERDELAWRALHDIDRWDQRTVDVVRRLIRRAKNEHIWWAVDIVYLISADQPQLAPQVVAEVLEKATGRGNSRGTRFVSGNRGVVPIAAFSAQSAGPFGRLVRTSIRRGSGPDRVSSVNVVLVHKGGRRVPFGVSFISHPRIWRMDSSL